MSEALLSWETANSAGSLPVIHSLSSDIAISRTISPTSSQTRCSRIRPFYRPPPNQGNEAWKIAATFIPTSFAWDAGDISLTAYIQSLALMESNIAGVSTLGAVMSFLYVLYIVIYAILSPTLEKYVGQTIAGPGVHAALYNIAGVHFSVLAAVILCATLIPKGTLSLNPALLHDEDLNKDLAQDELIDEKSSEPEKANSSSAPNSLKEKQRLTA